MRFIFLLAVVITTSSCKSYAAPKEELVNQEQELLEVISRTIAYPGATGDVLAYTAKPKGQGNWPSVIVLHDNEGLTLSTEDLVKRIAARGFYVIAPDGLSQISGTPDVHDEVVSAMDQVDYATTKRNFAAVVDFIESNPTSSGKIGLVGLGWGGKMGFDLISTVSDIDAAVVFNSFPVAEKEEAIFGQDVKVLLQIYANENLDKKEIIGLKEGLKENRNTELYFYSGSEKKELEDILLEDNTDSNNFLGWKRTINFLKDELAN